MSDYIKKIRKQVGQELLILPSAAAIIFDDNQRLLLGKHRGFNKWVTPGGMVEPGELPADAAKREAWEETGLIVEPVENLAVQGGPLFQISYLHGDKAAYTSTWFRCEIRGGELKRNNEEMSEMRFFTEEDVTKEKDLMPWLIKHQEIVFRSGTATYFERATWTPD